jgi:micrococcal nuclease
MNRQGIVSALFVLALIGLGLITETITQPSDQAGAAAESIILKEFHELLEDVSTATAPDAPHTEVAENRTVVEVVRIVDGDTLVVDGLEGQETVRLIGVDTPESVHPTQPVECFGIEASAFLKELLPSGSVVELETDPSQGTHDRYGRRLAYVFLPGNTNVNKTIIEEGFGHEYTYQLPYAYQHEFKQAEKNAREQARGLWGTDACS